MINFCIQYQEQLFTLFHKLKDVETLKDNRIINSELKGRVETYEIEYICGRRANILYQ